jgi:hypothetical protein
MRFAARCAAGERSVECNSNQPSNCSAVVPDGVPFDIDSFDPRYLREDMRRAIRELAAQRIRCACLSLDAASLDVAVAMFGANASRWCRAKPASSRRCDGSQRSPHSPLIRLSFLPAASGKG